MKRVIALLLVAVLVYGISQNPRRWAKAGKHVGNQIATAADGFGTFITDLAT
jgi:hypothetical protein